MFANVHFHTGKLYPLSENLPQCHLTITFSSVLPCFQTKHDAYQAHRDGCKYQIVLVMSKGIGNSKDTCKHPNLSVATLTLGY